MKENILVTFDNEYGLSVKEFKKLLTHKQGVLTFEVSKNGGCIVRLFDTPEEAALAVKVSDEKPDEMLERAKEFSRAAGYVSVSYLQRVLLIGYTGAARLVGRLQDEGFCSKSAEGSRFEIMEAK